MPASGWAGIPVVDAVGLRGCLMLGGEIRRGLVVATAVVAWVALPAAAAADGGGAGKGTCCHGRHCAGGNRDEHRGPGAGGHERSPAPSPAPGPAQAAARPAPAAESTEHALP